MSKIKKSVEVLAVSIVSIVLFQGCANKKDSGTNIIYKKAVTELVKESNRKFYVNEKIVNYNKGL